MTGRISIWNDEEPFLVAGLERAQHLGDIAEQLGVIERRSQVSQGPADVDLAQADQLPGLLGETPHIHRTVQEQRRDLGAVEQVLQVALGQRQVFDLEDQLAVDGLQLLVHRLHLFLGGRQLLVGRLQFLDRRLKFLHC